MFTWRILVCFEGITEERRAKHHHKGFLSSLKALKIKYTSTARVLKIDYKFMLSKKEAQLRWSGYTTILWSEKRWIETD